MATPAPQNRTITRHAAGGLRWYLGDVRDLPVVARIIEDPEQFLQNEDLQFKSSRVVTVTRVPPKIPGEPSLVLRRLNYGKLIHQLRDCFRPTRVLRAFHQATLLGGAGIATPRALAAAEVRCCRWPRRAYLLTEEVPGAQTLTRFLRDHHRVPSKVTYALADLLARLHDHGFSHRDLKPTNVLIDLHLRPWLIDLDGLRQHGSVSTTRARADLLRFARGISHYLRPSWWSGNRFLRHYCQARGIPDEHRSWAEWLRMTLEPTLQAERLELAR